MAIFDEASPICRGKNLSWETVLLFFNNMPREAMPKAKFNSYVESGINAWTQTHSQIARQLAFYYEENGMCYPRFTQKTTLQDLFAYMQNWAAKYFIPNPYTPSLRGKVPTCIYSFIIKSIKDGQTDFDEILDSIFHVKLSSHDKVNVYLSYFTNLLIDNNHQVSISENIGFVDTELYPSEEFATDSKKYYEYFTLLLNDVSDINWKCVIDNPLQQIYYGAPGTGKSFDVDNVCKKYNHYRVTFHPDTDYSSFVGCYKPKTHKKNMLKGNGINETQLLSSFFDSNSPKYNRMNKARYLYEALIHTKDIRDLGLDAQSVADKLNAKGFGGCAYTTEATCMYNIYDWLVADGFVVENSICYEFVPQAFTKAYLDAWKHQAEGTPVFLVIEEINRGNCAQIFGDLFQLLDRDKDGFSRYEISPDNELQEHINGEGLVIKDIYDSEGKDISDLIASGELMKLPNNLYIWATMNTSDQSLFPIDSAFKRRWDWKYMKIRKGKDENGNELDWKIVVKDKDKNIVKINNEDSLSWCDFIEKINEIIASMTSSADKQLGYFFCKADEKANETDKDCTIISANTFVGKVLFYLWNDVFKDYGFEDASLFRYTDNDSKEKDLTFPDFYDEDGEKVNTERLTDFVKKVMNWKKTSEENN